MSVGDSCGEHHKRIVICGTIFGIPDVLVFAQVPWDKAGLWVGIFEPAFDKIPTAYKSFISQEPVLQGELKVLVICSK